MTPEIKILKRLRRMLVQRKKRLDVRFDIADRTRDVFKAAELQAEQSGVNWSIHDLDFLVEQLRKKQL